MATEIEKDYLTPPQGETLHAFGIPTGAAAAAVIAAGIGALVLGLATVGCEVSPAFKASMQAWELGQGVGPLAGKTGLSVVAYLLSWGILHALWKDKEMDFGQAITKCLVLVGLGILGTFPTFFQAFTVE